MRRSGLVLAAMAAVIALVLWAGWHNLRARRLAMQKQAESQAMVMPDMPMKPGDAPMDMGPGAPSPLENKPAPVFTLDGLDGKKISLSDYKGRPMVVNFWATWCGPCKVEMPWFEEFRKKYAADGFEVLGVADDVDAGKDVIAKTVQKAGVTYPILLASDAMEKSYGDPEVLPMSFYIDKTGKVISVTAGLGSKDELEAKVKEVIAGGAK